MKQQITPFLAAAQAKGCPIQVGTDMLFEQIPAYLEFFGFGHDHRRRAARRLPDQELTRCRTCRPRLDGGRRWRRACTGWRCRWASTACPPSAPTCCTTTTGDVLVDCGIAAPARSRRCRGASPDPCGALDAGAAGGRAAGWSGSPGWSSRTRTSTTSGWPARWSRRSGGELWMHEASRLDLDKYHDPDEAVDRRMLMLADHGLYGRELTESSEGLLDWMPVMPSIGAPGPAAGRRGAAGRGRPRAGRSCTPPGTRRGTCACGRPPTGCSARATTCCRSCRRR